MMGKLRMPLVVISPTRVSHSKMDLWDSITDILLKNVNGGSNFKVTDILALASRMQIQLKPPRNSNSSQISFLLKDLLDELVRQGCTPLDFITRMTQVRPFEQLGHSIKDQLLSDSITRINSALVMMQEQNREIARLI